MTISVPLMWRQILLNTLVVTAAIYALLGFSAAIRHARPLYRIPIVTLASSLLGLTTAAALGAVPALLIAALYASIPYSMPSFHALLWGCGQGLLIALLNAGIFHRLL
eukprot:GFKZ01008996.1.p1 GENE.GFKZ01008996.1~~GFKZ01008996.1.p1  ORF type:complete len:108 (+),score=7.43 GFKZ01008996.1:344-667(+)